MKIVLLYLLALVHVTWALQLTTNVDVPDSKKLLPFPIDRRGSNNLTVEVALENGYLESPGGAYYYITMDVGTPPQTVKLLLDTGSNDFWV